MTASERSLVESLVYLIERDCINKDAILDRLNRLLRRDTGYGSRSNDHG